MIWRSRGRRNGLMSVIALFILCGTVYGAPPVEENVPTDRDSVGTGETSLSNYPCLVITEDDIRSSGAMVIGEILNRLPGIEVIDRGYLGQSKSLSFEGFPGDHLLILIDDEVVNDMPGGAFDVDMIPLSAVDRIELIRHPSLLERDARGSGGAIRIHTKRHEGGRAFSRLTLAGGSLGTNYQEGYFRRGIIDGRVGLSIAFDRVATRGFRMEEDYKAFQYDFRIDDLTPDWIDWSLTGSGTKSSGRLSGGASTPGVDVENEFRHLKFRTSLIPDASLPIEFSGYFTDDGIDSLVRDDSALDTRRKGARKGMRVSGEFRYIPDLVVSYGAEKEFSALNGADDIDTFSFFSGAAYRAPSLPLVEFAGRWEREGSRFSGWSGGFTSSYPLRGGTSLFASFMRTRHIPSLFERQGSGGGDGRLRNERTMETGLTAGIGNFQGSMTGFFRWSEPVVPSATGEPGSPLPGEDRLGVLGYRIHMSSTLGRHLNFSAGYQGIHLEEAPNGVAELSVPRHLFTGEIELAGTLMKEEIGYSCDLSGTVARGRGQASPGSPAGDDHYGYLDLNARFRLIDVTLFYTVRNALNGGFEVVEGFPMPGRVQRFGLRWNFFD